MRLKKGFTLAEVLIVLMVIGVIATLTVPSLVQNVNQTQWKTAYKKAYSLVSNTYSMESINGIMPQSNNQYAVMKIFDAIRRNATVRGYAKSAVGDDGKIPGSDNYQAGVKYTVDSAVVDIASGDQIAYTDADKSPWIITEDGLAYQVRKGSSNCKTKSDINAASGGANAEKAACVVVVVDVNGLSTLPNTIEAQVTSTLTKGTEATKLLGDRYYVFVGNDGVASGNPNSTLTGRILGDVK